MYVLSLWRELGLNDIEFFSTIHIEHSGEKDFTRGIKGTAPRLETPDNREENVDQS
jgi:hypothetical protein